VSSDCGWVGRTSIEISYWRGSNETSQFTTTLTAQDFDLSDLSSLPLYFHNGTQYRLWSQKAQLGDSKLYRT
jgi:hypothetical protein